MKSIAVKVFLLTLILHSPLTFSQDIWGTVRSADEGSGLVGATVLVKGTTTGTATDINGRFALKVDSLNTVLEISYLGYTTKEIDVCNFSEKVIEIFLLPELTVLNENTAPAQGLELFKKRSPLIDAVQNIESLEIVAEDRFMRAPPPPSPPKMMSMEPDFNTEGYASIEESGFKKVSKNPLSTFSVDVDGAAYSNTRRFINRGHMPHKDVVRIEEMINYFSYDYETPKDNKPFALHTELSTCPWNEENLLLHVGLQGQKINLAQLPPSNIVFLIDVSGSMQSPNKLPLLKSSITLLVDQLRPEDRVAMVVYAGNAGLVLPSTSGANKGAIIGALNSLRAGGSTAGGEGLKLAYKIVAENFIDDGNNRIVLATDGDFNVGVSSNGEMQRLVEKEREHGTAISVLGFGMGNYKDDKMEIIANKGNGNYSYIDNILEAKKVLVSEFGGTFHTIAKDVKLQLEFNPKHVSQYRLIGYENRLLNEEDFDDDKKDAGEIGAGHSVTALYEIIPSKDAKPNTDLKYQTSTLTKTALESKDLVTLKLRYKAPKGKKSKLYERVVKNKPLPAKKLSNDFRFSASVAMFGMLLRDSKFVGSSTWESTIELAKSARGKDENGYRAEMIRLVETAELLSFSVASEE